MYPLKNKTFQIVVHGCRTNQYEGEAIASLLENAGATYAESNPEIVVFVTCTITAVADRKCRKQIRKLRREYPNAVIVVCGCYVQKMDEAEKQRLEADIYVGNRRKFLIPQLLAEKFSEKKEPVITDISSGLQEDFSWDGLTLDKPRLHTRAFLKVQDGCNHYCSYCIVPYVRGKPVSRDLDESLEEARKIVSSGCPEIVLTGIHLGLYEKLPALVRRVGAIPGLKRLRFGSIEPFALDDALLDALAETPTFCPHLHLPLQSGDDGVLKNMRRGYTADEFAEIVSRAREKLGERLHISTDLMVAFPGEDERAFENSMHFLKKISFGKVHVFPYSPREGTDAARQSALLIPQKTAQERVRQALSLATELHKNYCETWIGETVSVLVEKTEGKSVRGLTPHFVRVAGSAPSAKVGAEVSITPVRYENEMLLTDDIDVQMNFGDQIAEFL